MHFGRIKIWFRKKEMTPYLGRKGLLGRIFGQEVVRWCIEPEKKGDNQAGIHVFRTMRVVKDFAGEKAKSVSDYGYTTYWIWRFMLTIHTQEFHLKNPWV